MGPSPPGPSQKRAGLRVPPPTAPGAAPGRPYPSGTCHAGAVPLVPRLRHILTRIGPSSWECGRVPASTGSGLRVHSESIRRRAVCTLPALPPASLWRDRFTVRPSEQPRGRTARPPPSPLSPQWCAPSGRGRGGGHGAARGGQVRSRGVLQVRGRRGGLDGCVEMRRGG